MKHATQTYRSASPYDEGIAFVMPRGEEDAPRVSDAFLRRPEIRVDRRGANSFGASGGGVCRKRGPSPPPGASSGLDRLSRTWSGRRWPVQTADAPSSPSSRRRRCLRRRGRQTVSTNVTRDDAARESLAEFHVEFYAPIEPKCNLPYPPPHVPHTHPHHRRRPRWQRGRVADRGRGRARHPARDAPHPHDGGAQDRRAGGAGLLQLVPLRRRRDQRGGPAARGDAARGLARS